MNGEEKAGGALGLEDGRHLCFVSFKLKESRDWRGVAGREPVQWEREGLPDGP